jgi:hypothetical protein
MAPIGALRDHLLEGGKLLQPLLDLMDKRGMPCYLNTQNEKNIGLYGFCVVEQVRLQGTEILNTGMLGKSGGDQARST